MSDTSLVSLAAKHLGAAGFFVQQDVRIRLGGADLVLDLLGWSNARGELERDVIVEVKRNVRKHLDSALAQLSRVASLIGPRRVYIFDGEWLEVDPTFRTATPSDPPRPLQPGVGRAPEDLVRETVQRELFAKHDSLRSKSDPWLAWSECVRELVEKEASQSGVQRLLESPVNARTVARVLASLAAEVAVPTQVALALARLACVEDGWRVLDPSCQVGACLLAIDEEAHAKGFNVELSGWCALGLEVKYGGLLMGLGGVSADLHEKRLTDEISFSGEFDAVVSALPFGLRSSHPLRLSSGTATTDLDLVALDRAASVVRNGGRAVLLLAPRLLIADGAAARLRQELASTMRVLAVIELPAGVFRGANVAAGIVVLEKSGPGPTLVCRLTDDWEEQLSEDGDFMRAYRAHLRSIPS